MNRSAAICIALVSAVALVYPAFTKSGQQEKPAGARWEYHVTSAMPEINEGKQIEWDDLGSAGWELVGIYSKQDAGVLSYRAVFKRLRR